MFESGTIDVRPGHAYVQNSLESDSILENIHPLEIDHLWETTLAACVPSGFSSTVVDDGGVLLAAGCEELQPITRQPAS